ncbi:MAG: hypothetical protein GC166_02275 [Alphaproteobacteria bacterium]|nr:hypothetical protein [Alphaproteobacteria bacterium]
MRPIFASIACVLLLSGCATVDGASWAITQKGIFDGSRGSYTAVEDLPHPAADNPIPRKVVDIDLPRVYSESALDPYSADKAKALLDVGFAVIESNCEGYFDSSGTTQRWIFVSRDTIGAVGTLATGVLGALGAGTPTIAWVGLATGSAYSGLDIFSKHFLFASENIDAVHDLVRRQLLSEQADARKSIGGTGYTFFAVRQAMLGNQITCSDAHILSLVRTAIAEGKAKGDPELAQRQAERDKLAKEQPFKDAVRAIGEKINDGGAVATHDQIVALLWFYELNPQSADERAAIYSKLGDTKVHFVTSNGQVAPDAPTGNDRNFYLDALDKIQGSDEKHDLMTEASNARSTAIEAAKSKAAEEAKAAEIASKDAAAKKAQAEADQQAAQATIDQAKAAQDAADAAAKAKEAAEKAVQDQEAAKAAADAAKANAGDK